jgi:DNA-binding transcriptional ArsR family regulator
MGSKMHDMSMSYIYMDWIFLKDHKVTPEELADHMEQSWKTVSGKLAKEDRQAIIAAMERGITVRTAEPSDLWIATIRIIRSRTEYF